MRIGYVVKRYPRYSETFIVNEILAHEAAGLDVHIFALLPPQDTHFQDIIARVRAPVTYLPAESGKAIDWWETLRTTARGIPGIWHRLAAVESETAREVLQALVLAHAVHERGLQHLHAHFATAATTVARLAAGMTGIGYSFTAHAKDIFHEEVQTEDLRQKFADAAFAVTVSDYNLAYLRERLGSAAARTRRIYNGLDLERFPFRAATDRRPQIITVGRLVEKKGFGDLLEACRLLAGRGVAFSCRIIGSGELESSLRERIAGLDLGEHVELCGPRPQQEVIGALQEAAAFAAPCVVGADGNRDGMPTVLLEAMALGTPCVATDVTGIPELLQDGDTGLLVAQRDPPALADALQRLLEDAVLRKRLAAQARARIEAEFDVHRNAARLRELFAGAAVPQAGRAVAL